MKTPSYAYAALRPPLSALKFQKCARCSLHLSCLGSFPGLFFYQQFDECLKPGVRKELMKNQFVSLKEYEEQFGKCLKLGMKDFSIASGS